MVCLDTFRNPEQQLEAHDCVAPTWAARRPAYCDMSCPAAGAAPSAPLAMPKMTVRSIRACITTTIACTNSEKSSHLQGLHGGTCPSKHPLSRGYQDQAGMAGRTPGFESGVTIIAMPHLSITTAEVYSSMRLPTMHSDKQAAQKQAVLHGCFAQDARSRYQQMPLEDKDKYYQKRQQYIFNM